MIPTIPIRNYNYDLPDSSVAKYPLAERDQSRLLVWGNNQISDHQFSDLPGLLPPGAMLVFNNTRVIRARLLFTKPTGAKIEVFCLEPTNPPEYVQSFAQTTSCRWKCIVGNLKRWKGEVLEMEVSFKETGDRKPDEGTTGTTGTRGREDEGTTGRPGDLETRRPGDCGLKTEDCGLNKVVLRAEKVGDLDGGSEVEFSWENNKFTFSEILEAAGNIPIPPYLHREAEEIDATVYQTVYSKIKGSVAAPTAGLHFTERVFKELTDKNISCDELTLHVGAGTFQPVKSETIDHHLMHTEHFSVGQELVAKLITHPGEVVAVGTTSVRTLESLYWIGCKIALDPGITAEKLQVDQWEPYREDGDEISTAKALQAILEWMKKRSMKVLDTSTQIMILPGYRLRVITGLLTNFHQPQSTLLLLISAILGEDWKRVYAHALANGYRFLSYGDSNLYWVPDNA